MKMGEVAEIKGRWFVRSVAASLERRNRKSSRGMSGNLDREVWWARHGAWLRIGIFETKPQTADCDKQGEGRGSLLETRSGLISGL